MLKAQWYNNRSLMTARLYVVSTPIGNLDDITLRALTTLKSVALIAAEDTRRTSNLLRHFGITTPVTSYHEHNERQKRPYLLGRLTSGSNIALVSDAGTPTVADPGQRLIAEAIAQGIEVTAIPGASAVLAALTISGFAADEFVFAGFIPARSKDRMKFLSSFVDESRSVVLFEAPHRIRKTVVEMDQIFGIRPIIIARELTKLHEQVIRGAANSLRPEMIPEKGEFVIVLGPISETKEVSEHLDESSITAYFYQLTKNGLARRPALAQTAHHFGLSTNNVYSLLERTKATRPS